MVLSSKFPGVAFITGAGGPGIGAAAARAFASAGCNKLFLTDINKAALAQTRADVLKINSRAQVETSAGDIADSVFVESLGSSVESNFSRIDYAVNCAGIVGPRLRSHETSIDSFDRVNGVNYRGIWMSSKMQLNLMLKQNLLPEHPKQRGSIVNIASQLGLVARPTYAPYNGSKAAVINLTRSEAIDYSKNDIRVNCVCPGVIATPMTTRQENWQEYLGPAIALAPMNRMGTPEEVAAAVLFLSSTDASFIQGHALVVDGGYTIN